jgi:hypothetical protein
MIGSVKSAESPDSLVFAHLRDRLEAGPSVMNGYRRSIQGCTWMLYQEEMISLAVFAQPQLNPDIYLRGSFLSFEYIIVPSK